MKAGHINYNDVTEECYLHLLYETVVRNTNADKWSASEVDDRRLHQSNHLINFRVMGENVYYYVIENEHTSSKIELRCFNLLEGNEVSITQAIHQTPMHLNIQNKDQQVNISADRSAVNADQMKSELVGVLFVQSRSEQNYFDKKYPDPT